MDYLVRYDYTDLEKRARHRSAHLEHLRRLRDQGSLLLAGVAADSSGGLIVLRADTDGELADMLAADPYDAGGVRENLTITPFTVAVAGTTEM